MQQNFGSPVWIDHGYNNKASNNREDIVCDGLLRSSPLKASKYWKKYGVRYFWNTYVEDAAPFTNWNFDGQLLQPYPGFGDAFPNRIFTSIPTGYEGYLWTTSGTLEVPKERMWNYFFSEERLQKLIDYRGMYLAHVYPAWVQQGKGYWTIDSTGRMVAQTEFNKALERISHLRDNNKLLPATVTKLLSYYEQLQLISIDYQTDGSVFVNNNGSNEIKGLSLITSASSVKVNGQTPSSKQLGNSLIFWFDIGAFDQVTIRFLPQEH